MLKTVALLASAWIEIKSVLVEQKNNRVALLASAWIEISKPFWSFNHWKSRTPRECVDWNPDGELGKTWFGTSRTPRECVDWNNSNGSCKYIKFVSHSSRVRGLKSENQYSSFETFIESHSSRVRGLKYPNCRCSTSASMSHSSRVRGLKCYFPYSGRGTA